MTMPGGAEGRRIFDSERATFFDTLAHTWDERVPPRYECSVRRVMKAARIDQDSVILDVGTGTGRLIPYVLDCGPKQVIACDISAEMLRCVRRRFQHNAMVSTLLADARDLPLGDRSIDVIICHEVYPHFAEKTAAVRELFRVARPGGRFIISHFGGRDFVNRVHLGVSYPLIRKDILPPVNDVAAVLRIAGFTVEEALDEDDLYLIATVKPI